MKTLRLSVLVAMGLLSGILGRAGWANDVSAPLDEKSQMILIVVDGMQEARLETMLSATQVPNFSRLMGKKGGHTTVAITQHKTPITAPGNAELLTGLGSAVTGIVDNSCGQPLPAGSTVFERLREFNATLRFGSIYGKGTCYIPEGLLKNAKPGIEWWQSRTSYQQRTYVDDKCADAQDVATKSLEFISKYRTEPFFLLIYFGNPDCAGHKFGVPSPEYDQAMSNVDAGLGILLDGISKNNVQPSILVSADHGWNEGTKTHSTPDANTMTIPLLYSDANLIGSNQIPERNHQCDIAPTILNFFGMQDTAYSDITQADCASLMLSE